MDLLNRLRAKQAQLANRMNEVGHHSPEARAIQTFMRAFDGWCCGGLAAEATLVLAHQGAEDWLRTRVLKSHWDPTSFVELVSLGLDCQLIDRREALKLDRLHQSWRRVHGSGMRIQRAKLAALLFWLIEFIERRW